MWSRKVYLLVFENETNKKNENAEVLPGSQCSCQEIEDLLWNQTLVPSEIYGNFCRIILKGSFGYDFQMFQKVWEGFFCWYYSETTKLFKNESLRSYQNSKSFDQSVLLWIVRSNAAHKIKSLANTH